MTTVKVRLYDIEYSDKLSLNSIFTPLSQLHVQGAISQFCSMTLNVTMSLSMMVSL